MTFASIEYIIFLPVVFLFYWIVCRKNKNLQNGLIVLASLFFYGFRERRSADSRQLPFIYGFRQIVRIRKADAANLRLYGSENF